MYNANNNEKSILRMPKSGFTWRAALAIVYAAVVFLPAHMWLQLSSGIMLSLGLSYATLLLFTEISRIWGKPLSKQEVFLIWAMTSQIAWEVGLFSFPLGMIYRTWYASSPIAQAFGLAEHVPSWWAPINSKQILILRNLLHNEFFVPIILTLITGILWRLTDLTLGYICRQIYVVTEKLPFPMARVGADLSLVLSERPPEMTKILVLTAIISQFYSALIFIPRIIYGTTIIPYPWVDITPFIEKFVPGASFAIATDPAQIIAGLIMPFHAVISMFIGSFAVYFVGNWLASPQSPLKISQGIFSDWMYGMSAEESYTRSVVYVWANVLIGLSLAAGLLPILRRPSTLIKSLKSLSKVRRGETGFPLWLLILIYIVATSGSAIMTYLLVQDYPLYILILISVGWVFFINLVAARSLGEIGVGLDLNSIPILQALYTISSTSPRIWFGSTYLVTTSYGAGWCQNFRICELTETTISSYVKAYFFTFPLALFIAFIYSQALWSIAPIPSSAYPYANIQFPVSAQWFSLWASRSLNIFNVQHILYSFGIGSLIYTLCETLHLPFSVMGLAIGAGSFIAGITTVLIGGLIGIIVSMKMGKLWWDKNKAIIAAGVALGEGMIVAIATAISIIAKSMWILPF